MGRNRKTEKVESTAEETALSRRNWLKAATAGTAAAVTGLSFTAGAASAASDATGHGAGVEPATIDRYVYESSGTYYVADGEGGSVVSSRSRFNDAIQNAIQDLAGAGGNVVVADGDYWLSDTTPIQMATDVNIYGRGGATIHLDWGSSDTHLFNIEDRDGWTIDGLEIIAETLSGSYIIGDEPNIPAKYNCSVSNCTFRGSGWAMINWDNMQNSEIVNCLFQDVDTLGGGNGTAVRHHSCDNCVIRDCVFESGTGSPRTLLFIDDRNNTFENNEFYPNGNEWNAAIEFAADGGFEIYGNEIRGNYLEGSGAGGGVYAVTTNTTSTNYVENNEFRDLAFGHDCTDSGGGFYVANNAFVNCTTDYALASTSEATNNTNEEPADSDQSDAEETVESTPEHTYEVENTSENDVDYFLQVEDGTFTPLEYEGSIINEELMWTDGDKAAGRVKPGETHCWGFNHLLVDVTIRDSKDAEARVNGWESNLGLYPRAGAAGDDWKDIEALLGLNQDESGDQETSTEDTTSTEDSGNRWSNATEDDDWIVALRERIENR